MIFDGKVAEVLPLVGLAILPECLRLEAVPFRHLHHAQLLLPHLRLYLLLLLEPPLVAELARLHPVLDHFLLPLVALLHHASQLPYLLLVKALDAAVDVLAVGLVDKVELFLSHHTRQFL
jgi:hypothetical protein